MYVDNGHVLLNPIIKSDGTYKALKKARIINKIVSSVNYHNKDLPIVIINMGILRKYDNAGVKRHLETINRSYNEN